MNMFSTVSGHVETVVSMSKLHIDDFVSVSLSGDELPVTKAEMKASYNDIADYVMEKHNVKVSTLDIAEVKRKYGITERECFKKTKSSFYRQPKVTKEKEEFIVEAMKHFKMI
jgi:23S rRNA (uracil1939-C5)-methyltransferase